MTNVLINGEFNKSISIFDRGIQYGDGLFETMAVIQNKIQFLDEHWNRLTEGCQRLAIPVPDKVIIESEIVQLVSSHTTDKCIIKLILTRGTSERGYKFPKHQNITRILSCHCWPEYPEDYYSKGVSLRYCDTTISENVKLAGIKHLNRLEQVLARNEWDSDEFQEGLMSTMSGRIVDGTMSNIFAVKDNRLFTPDLATCGISGVMRGNVIKMAKKLGYEVYEKDFTRSELEDADELFITNSIIGIWPVKVVAKTRFTRVGKITQQLMREVDKNR